MREGGTEAWRHGGEMVGWYGIFASVRALVSAHRGLGLVKRPTGHVRTYLDTFNQVGVCVNDTTGCVL